MFALHQANSSTRGSQQQLSSNETSTSTTSSTLDSFVMRNAWKIRQIQKTINKYPIKVGVYKKRQFWAFWTMPARFSRLKSKLWTYQLNSLDDSHKKGNLEKSNRVRKSMSWDSESKSQISISTEATTVDKEPEYYERSVRPDMPSMWPRPLF